MKYTAIAFTLSLAACGGSGSGGGSDEPTSSGAIKKTETTTEITGNNHTATINSTQKTGISVSGNKNTIYIQTPVLYIDIIGNDNIIELSNGVTVDECEIMGNRNKANKSADIKLTCQVFGNENTGF